MLIPCPECGQNVSTTARRCVGCGARLSLPWYRRRGAFYAGLALALVLISLPLFLRPPEPAAPAPAGRPADFAIYEEGAALARIAFPNVREVSPYSEARITQDGSQSVVWLTVDWTDPQDGPQIKQVGIEMHKEDGRWKFHGLLP